MQKKINIAIIGFGERARVLVKTIKEYISGLEESERPLFNITAVTDVRKEVTKELEKLGFSDVHLYENAEDMYKNESFDGVIVATRCHLHTDFAMLDAKYGIPMILEKPVATSFEQIEKLKSIVPSMNEKVIVSFPLRAAPVALKAKEIAESGVLGKISQIQAVNNVPYARDYFHGWYRDDKETGGLFLQKATHDLDVIEFIMGNPVPMYIAAMESKQIFKGDKEPSLTCDKCEERQSCPESDINVRSYKEGFKLPSPYMCCYAKDTGNHDSASILIKYKNGINAVYSQNFVARKQAANRSVRIIGYNATLELSFTTNKIKVYHHFENKIDDYDLSYANNLHHGGGDMEICKNFFEVMDKKPSIATLQEGINSAFLCLCAKKSAENNIFIKI